ncbi:MAG: hypothetical protein AAGC64_09760 [Bacteroidota bacterium]
MTQDKIEFKISMCLNINWQFLHHVLIISVVTHLKGYEAYFASTGTAAKNKAVSVEDLLLKIDIHPSMILK